MNVKTFKKLCLKADTKKTDQIHDYYVKWIHKNSFKQKIITKRTKRLYVLHFLQTYVLHSLWQ